MANDKTIWDFLKNKGLNDYAVAGIMGNLYAESALNPKNLQQTCEKKLGYTDDSYTAAVDNGSYTNFVKDSAGYGLAQWTYWSRKQNLLDYAKAAGKSIGDLTMQLGFLWQELQGYKGVMQVLNSATSVLEASNVVLTQYERPADTGTTVQSKRAGYGQQYYDKYAAETIKTTTSKTREAIVALAKSWLGKKEADGSHKAIIDLYNSHKPLARGYAVKYTDAWCAAFIAALAIACGCTDIIPTECGCEKMIELLEKLGVWVENDAYVPKMGDIIFYDWQDSGAGDNTGYSDHVGIVESVSGSTITVIEGNINDAVGRRTLQVNGKYIRGYGVPKYTESATTQPAQTTTAEPAQTKSYAVGEVVNFTGNKHYTSANAASGKACKAGIAKVTQVYQLGKSKHPYHLVREASGGSNVYGWVDAADISGTASEAAAVRTHKVAAGENLTQISKKYGTTINAIVVANKKKYPKITANYIVTGWELIV